MSIGASYLGDGRCRFSVWAPERQEMAVDLLDPQPRQVAMERVPGGYWQAEVDQVVPSCRYRYILDGQLERPDPASQLQPEGVHGPSAVVDHSAHRWQDGDWRGVALQDYVIYELHVGTFTPEGDFDGVIERLPVLKDLGITAVEIMPVAQFPGDRNWGYDGVYPYAVQTSYGGPAGLKRLVDACHQQGLAVILDVVYNHFGPEGNYTADFGPYFTDTYNTPWGSAINYDDAYSQGVRHFAIANALFWLREYHIDALRLDAIHAIYDCGARHVLAEMQDRTDAFATTRAFPAYLIAESDLNDVRVIHSPEKGGHGIAAQWCDDFHHSLHALLTGEGQGYYEDFGRLDQMAKALEDSFVYDWTYSPHRRRFHGSDASDCPPSQFVVCGQNHDQVGNRMLGERLSTLVSLEAQKLAAGTVLLSPYLPLIFMGEEYGETQPFLYFISHGDQDLVAAVREGRKREFAAFHDLGDPPDAASTETFAKCQLQWHLHNQGAHGMLWQFYRRLIRMRREAPALQGHSRKNLSAHLIEPSGVICLQRWSPTGQILALMNFQPIQVEFTPVIEGSWHLRLDSAAPEWLGPGSLVPQQLHPAPLKLQPHSFVVYDATIAP
ncbi:malto-oligosyltrehalose trehalohydrolase [filamentous cyanobacterium CCP5]|nr:malto-oligosyltrehalose trehalohydrolase [filamentous cyanobacterium CCP5]